MPPIITVEHLSKRYRLGALRRHNSLRDIFDEKLHALLGKSGIRSGSEENFIWALNGCVVRSARGRSVRDHRAEWSGEKHALENSFSYHRADKGIRCGCKAESRRFLEVGTGFSGELSGRENIFLNGAILGMTKTEIKRKFDEIVAFAEIEKFIDTPVKQYSSGMYMRLAFAVAAHLSRKS